MPTETDGLGEQLTRRPPEDEPRSLLMRLRDRTNGDCYSAEAVPFGGGYQGPFATPPDEPVDLDPDLPWELRE